MGRPRVLSFTKSSPATPSSPGRASPFGHSANGNQRSMAQAARIMTFGDNGTPPQSPALEEFPRLADPLPMPSHTQALRSHSNSTSTTASRPGSGLRGSPKQFHDFPKDTPQELVPILMLLTSQQNRPYIEGYFMLLNDLNSDGKPAADRHWVEVFGRLTGTVVSIWDANSLENATPDTEPTPTYINITDSTFKAIPKLPSPSGELTNIVVLSTTMKNRFLLRMPTRTQLNEWTAAMRLSVFESTSLQEAYTGALLSAKGSKLNGVRTLLTESKFRHEEWVSVRFGSGMPWKRCWTVTTPAGMKKKKHAPPPGTVAFYEDAKKIKKGPLAVIKSAYATYAVYPQSSLLVDGSTLIKVEGKVEFTSADGEKDATVFLMPEQHPGVIGSETLIRYLIPLLDVFKLYGRPSRLNADKSDLRSLLFGMPTLPRAQYLELSDLVLVTGVAGSENWSSYDWNRNIKELLARKMSSGYKGAGNILNTPPSTSSNSPKAAAAEKDRSVSMPISRSRAGAAPGAASSPLGGELLASPNLNDSSAGLGSFAKDLNQSLSSLSSGNNSSAQLPSSSPYAGKGSSPRQPAGQQGARAAQRNAPPKPTPQTAPVPPAHSQGPSRAQTPQDNIPRIRAINANGTSISPAGSVYSDPSRQGVAHTPPISKAHRTAMQSAGYGRERSASEGMNPNNLIGKVDHDTKPVSPLMYAPEEFPDELRTSSRIDMRESIFGAREPTEDIDRIGARNAKGSFVPISPERISPERNSVISNSSTISGGSIHRVHRRPVSGAEHPKYVTPAQGDMFDPAAHTKNMFDPAAHTSDKHISHDSSASFVSSQSHVSRVDSAQSNSRPRMNMFDPTANTGGMHSPQVFDDGEYFDTSSYQQADYQRRPVHGR